jgi:choline dehydrogenase-like flavoprotein
MSGTNHDPVDVVVIGSGAGGSPVAYELAQAGVKVVVLEKGRQLADEELDHDEIKMCRRNFFVPYPHHEPHTMRMGESGKPMRTNEGWTANVVGGGTVHMSGYFLRMHPVDFKLKTTLGKISGASIEDWPIKYEDLEKYYARAEREIGVSGRWKAHPFEEPRSSDYPLPPLEEHPFAQRIDEASKKLGLHPFPTPRGIVSKPYRGRQACSYCALCGSYGCEIRAKSSTAVSLLPAAVATGKCEIRPRSLVTEISVDDAGKATGAVYRDEHGVTHFQPARFVVVACTAIESARLLLMSRSKRFPSGLANDSGLVGRNLVFSGLAKAHGIFKHKGKTGVEWMTDPRPFVQRSMQDFYLLDKPLDGLRKVGTILFDFYHPNPINNAERVSGRGETALWGKALKDALRDQASGARCLGFETFAEYLPTSGSYVDLDPEVKDKWNLPVARITISRHPLDLAASKLLLGKGLEVLRALGPESTETTIDHGETKILQGGTCRFGKDPSVSVLDPNCRAHSVPNLYVTDGSFLPTSGGVPLTLTILANSFRVADHLKKVVKT